MKKVVIAGLLCCVMLTGCAMPDKVSDMMMRDIEVGMLNSEEEIDEAMALASEKMEKEPWILLKTRQKQILELKQYLVEREKKGLFEVGYDDTKDKSMLERWAEAEEPDDESFFHYDTESSNWYLTFYDKDALMQFVRDMEKMGYTGIVAESVEKGMEAVSEIDGIIYPGATITCRGVTFNFEYMSEDEDSYAEVMIQVSMSSVRYPASLQQIVENTLSDNFSIEKIMGGGYLQAISIKSDVAVPESLYEKNVVLYLKDGKLLQIEMNICEPYWILQMQEEGSLKLKEKFFSQEECETLKKLLMMLGADETSAQDFLAKISPKSDKSGSLGSVNWYFQENKQSYYDSNDRNWFIRIQ